MIGDTHKGEHRAVVSAGATAGSGGMQRGRGDSHLQRCEPVFLVGMNGSGTTMLLDSLGRHPELFGFSRETRLLPHVIRSHWERGDLRNDDEFLRAWRSVQSIPAFSVVNNGALPPIPGNWRDFSRDVGVVIDAMLRYFAGKEGKVRWCEKSPQNLQHIGLLSSVFPGARFVHLIRDGRDCAASFHRRWRRTPELTIYRWRNVVEEGRRQGAKVGDRYLEVRYEELTADPAFWMQMICRFVGLSFDPVVLGSREPQSGKPNQGGKIHSNARTWRTYFSDAEVRRLENISGKYLAELGYTPRWTKGAEDPERWRLVAWRLRDLAWQYKFLLENKITGKRKVSWAQVVKQPLIAWRQAKLNKF